MTCTNIFPAGLLAGFSFASQIKIVVVNMAGGFHYYKNNYQLSGFVRAVGKSFYEKAEFDWYCQRCQKTVLSVSLVGVFHIFDFAKQTRPTNWLLTEQT